MPALDTSPSIARRLAEILRIHFDPRGGTPYWIERAQHLGFDPRERVQSIEDLDCLGLMAPKALRTRPLTDFIPRSIAAHPERLVVVQTGGTLAEPIWTAYTREDYEAAFVLPFVDAARHVGFPPGGTWLYIGPSGPHVIGRAANSIARATGAMEPFTIDFDSRWVKKLPPGSFAAQRYLLHIVEQALDVIRSQLISHLFTTPPVLAAVAERLSPSQRESIRGVHYGGLTITPEELANFQRDVFPAAVHLVGYGNTLFGCCLELDASLGRPLRYFPHGERILFGVLPDPNGPRNPIERAPGARGRLVFTRLDLSMLLVNFVERDEVELVALLSSAPAQFMAPGILNPRTASTGKVKPNIGIY